MASFSSYKVTNEIQVPVLTGTSDMVPGTFLNNLKEKMKIQIITLSEDEIVFDLIGVDASIANALRRIMLAEVPTMAIETVWIAINTSIIQDEVLAHRVGLIPLKADPSKFEFVQNDEETDVDTLVFHLDYSCNTENDRSTVLSGDLVWLPQGSQEENFPDGIRPVHDDIVIAKLSPGQRIEFEAHCRKGLGKDHAKYSPVATAAYRLLPDIEFLQPVVGADARELKTMCPMQVFDIEDIGGVETAKVSRPRDCTMCRECIRREGWAEKVELRRKADHFIFSVESSGCMNKPEDIVKEAIAVLKKKATTFQELVVEYQKQTTA